MTSPRSSSSSSSSSPSFSRSFVRLVALSTVLGLGFAFAPAASRSAARGSVVVSRSTKERSSSSSSSSSDLVSICSIPGQELVVGGRTVPVTGLNEDEEDDEDVVVATTDSSSSSSSSSSEYDWSWVDAVYLITCPNADPGSARLTKSLGVLREVGLTEDRVRVTRFETDDEDRVRGCYDSHVAVLRDAKELLERKRRRAAGGATSWFEDALRSWLRPPGSLDDDDDDDESSSGTTRVPKVLVFEDNLDLTGNLRRSILDAVADFADDSSPESTEWDMIHLAYTSYVPNLRVERVEGRPRVVRLVSGVGSALGTTSYVVSERAIDAVLADHDDRGGAWRGEAVPDVMARLFPETRHAAYPTPFLRASATKSLVNPQLDDLRSLLFRPAVYAFAERVLATTGADTNALLPAFVLATTLVAVASGSVAWDAAREIAQTGRYDGNVLLPAASALVATASLAIVAQGVALAPKPVVDDADATNDE